MIVLINERMKVKKILQSMRSLQTEKKNASKKSLVLKHKAWIVFAEQ